MAGGGGEGGGQGGAARPHRRLFRVESRRAAVSPFDCRRLRDRAVDGDDPAPRIGGRQGAGETSLLVARGRGHHLQGGAGPAGRGRGRIYRRPYAYAPTPRGVATLREANRSGPGAPRRVAAGPRPNPGRP